MKNKSYLESFRHASDGVKLLIKEERNMKIHIAMTILVILCAVIFNLTACEKAIVISLCFITMAFELVNTAIENAVDISSPVFNMYAKRAKDISAGAVLLVSIGSAVAGLIIFVPYGIRLLEKLIERI